MMLRSSVTLDMAQQYLDVRTVAVIGAGVSGVAAAIQYVYFPRMTAP